MARSQGLSVTACAVPAVRPHRKQRVSKRFWARRSSMLLHLATLPTLPSLPLQPPPLPLPLLPLPLLALPPLRARLALQPPPIPPGEHGPVTGPGPTAACTPAAVGPATISP